MNALRYRFLTLALTCLMLPAAGLAQTPAPTPLPQTGPPAAVSVDELTARIRAAIARPQYRRGQIGLKIVSLNTGKVLLEENADKYFMPASNLKNFTVAAGLETLSPDYRFVTSVYAAAPADSSGTVRGPLRIYGRGDVSISYTFNSNDYFRGIDLLADAITAAGIKRIEGDLIADETYFRGSPIPTGWEWD
nr:D-alanyl-D-alanine carboxypeptidase [Blastocatellia bacterium]